MIRVLCCGAAALCSSANDAFLASQAATLNLASRETKGLSAVDQSAAKEEALATRALLVDSLSDMTAAGPVTTGARSGLLGPLKEVTGTADEMTGDSTDKSMAMTSSLLQSSSSIEEGDAQMLAAATSNLLASSEVQHANVSDGSDVSYAGNATLEDANATAARNNASRARTGQVLGIVSGLGNAMINSRVAGEKPIKIKTGKFGMEAGRQSADKMANTVVGDGAVKIPDGIDYGGDCPGPVDPDTPKDVDSQLVEWDGNPFMSADSGDIKDPDSDVSMGLNSDVLSFTIKTCGGEELPVNNTKEPIVIRLKVAPNANGDNFTAPNCTDHREDCKAMLDSGLGVTCDTNFTRDFPENGIIGDMDSLCSETCESNCSTHQTTVSCSYFDVSSNLWRTDGVVVMRDNVSITCHFRHLTDFGAMFGPPDINLPDLSAIDWGNLGLFLFMFIVILGILGFLYITTCGSIFHYIHTGKSDILMDLDRLKHSEFAHHQQAQLSGHTTVEHIKDRNDRKRNVVGAIIHFVFGWCCRIRKVGSSEGKKHIDEETLDEDHLAPVPFTQDLEMTMRRDSALFSICWGESGDPYLNSQRCVVLVTEVVVAFFMSLLFFKADDVCECTCDVTNTLVYNITSQCTGSVKEVVDEFKTIYDNTCVKQCSIVEAEGASFLEGAFGVAVVTWLVSMPILNVLGGGFEWLRAPAEDALNAAMGIEWQRHLYEEEEGTLTNRIKSICGKGMEPFDEEAQAEENKEILATPLRHSGCMTMFPYFYVTIVATLMSAYIVLMSLTMGKARSYLWLESALTAVIMGELIDTPYGIIKDACKARIIALLDEHVVARVRGKEYRERVEEEAEEERKKLASMRATSGYQKVSQAKKVMRAFSMLRRKKKVPHPDTARPMPTNTPIAYALKCNATRGQIL